jgi:transposase
VDRLYRFMDRLNDQHKESAENISFEHTKKVLKGDINVIFYDMTKLYFEASSEDDLRRTGFSKDGKPQHPQIMLGLLVAKQGYPIGYQIFEGNTFEGHTLLPVLASFEQKFNLSHPTVVADAGLLSNNNIQLLVEAGYKYILGARIKNEKPQIKEQILSLNLDD